MSVKVTHHGQERTKDRIGVSKKIADRVAEKALEQGIKHGDVKMGNLKRYLDGLYLSHRSANNMRIYNHKVFVFNNETLITILNLPNNLCKVVDKMNNKKKEGKDIESV